MTRGRSDDLLVVGTGRMGLAIAWELERAGWRGKITLLGRKPRPPDHPLFATGSADYVSDGEHSDLPAGAILIAVPDDVIAEVADCLLARNVRDRVVLHTSGVLPSTVMEPLARSDCSLGSLHPLVSIADARHDAAKLRGAWYGLEGDPAAVRLGGDVIDTLDGRALRIEPARKPTYHAAAVFASNYLVTLLATAERLMADAGIPATTAREALGTLASGAVSNVADHGPIEALTGPISRGDDATIALHLEELSASDRRLYSVLADATLDLARARGLTAADAARVTRTLERDFS